MRTPCELTNGVGLPPIALDVRNNVPLLTRYWVGLERLNHNGHYYVPELGYGNEISAVRSIGIRRQKEKAKL